MENKSVKKLAFKQKLLVGFTLFGMFFGAGNLIFPIHLGQLAGRNFLPSMIGFIITAVGIPILGVAAIGNTHSDGLQSLANKVGRIYSLIFTILLYLTIGPFFAIPRCASTSFTTGLSPLIGDFSSTWALLIFSFIFFALVLFFSIKNNKITTWIGKIINPIFLIFLAIILVVALINSKTSLTSITPSADYDTFFKALSSSFIEGYATMDAIAGLAFGIVVIDIIKKMGVKNDEAIAKDVLSSGLLTGLLMAIIYILTIILGVKSLGSFSVSSNGGIALGEIANKYLGSAGNVILFITITAACLKTSIGLVTSCSETFVKISKNKIPYKAWAIIFTVISFSISNFGLSTIINYSIPFLMLLYPLAITLIALALTGKLFKHNRIIYICVTICTFIPALFDFIKTLPFADKLSFITDLGRKIFPLFDLNLGWLVPSLIGFIIGLIIILIKTKAKRA